MGSLGDYYAGPQMTIDDYKDRVDELEKKLEIAVETLKIYSNGIHCYSAQKALSQILEDFQIEGYHSKSEMKRVKAMRGRK